MFFHQSLTSRICEHRIFADYKKGNKMDKELESMFTRAEKLLGELEEEYNSCLHVKNVTEEAKHLTHEVLEKLKNVLNHTMAKV
jgi:type II secretory pathway predicted ATPase ExeA